MMWKINFKMALASLKSAKWRSFMTMLGIIIGVTSVVTTVSIGEGAKQEVLRQINQMGPNLITVRPGKAVNRDSDGNITGYNLLNVVNAGNLNEKDWQMIAKLPQASQAAPFNLVNSALVYDETTYTDAFIIGTVPNAPKLLNQELEYGTFFDEVDSSRPVAVIGKRIAERVFKENVPIGKSMEIRGTSFMVRGVFEEFVTSPLTPTVDYNNAVFIPYEASKSLTDSELQIYQILALPKDDSKTYALAESVKDTLLQTRAGQQNFTVLRQEENLAVANTILDLLTALIAGVAAVSLIVGGIGIMNIMLVSVTERTEEVGIRKAIGATNQQILGQFVIEAVVLSLAGGIIGIICSGLANYLLRIFTDLQPVITPPVIVIATGVSVLVGIIFGAAPALRAARKDPVVALRRD